MAVSETNTFKEQGLQRKLDEYDHEDEGEALSLSDLPIVGRGNCERNETSSSSCSALEGQDFEFGSWAEDDLPMCAADEVFFQGQILPLRPSVSSENGCLLSGFRPESQRTSRCGSRSDSMDRSLGHSSSMFSSRSSGSNRSSRSHSLSSSSSTFNFYTHPSPKPQMGSHQKRDAAKTSRKSTGWGVFRLGLMRTPEIELQDLKFRKRNSLSKNESRGSSSTTSISSGRKSTGSDGVKNLLEKKVKQQEQGLQRFFGGGFSCKCSAGAIDTVTSRIVILKSRKEEGDEEESLGKQAMSQRRTFEWLRGLSIPEAPVA